MNKAGIFDFDGVMIDNERFWEEEKKQMFQEVYGATIAKQLHKTLGLNMDAIHALATSYGSRVSAQKLYDACDKYAKHVYADAPITEGLGLVIEKLLVLNFSLAIVSASPKSWIDIALKRLASKNAFRAVISLHNRADLAHKPAPDGYNEAMKVLGTTPHETFVLEDSNTGIASAKASGAFTIGLKQNLIDGYTIEGADMYVDNIKDIISFASTFAV